MTKHEFLLSLQRELSNLPPDEQKEHLAFYSEMIDDRMEEGISEAKAVETIGSVGEIAAEILSEKAPREEKRPTSRMKPWEIVLLILGSPIWLSLLIAAFSIVFSLYISLWSVVVSLWAVFGSLVGCFFGGVIAGIGIWLGKHSLTGIAMIGGGMICAGLAIFLFYGCKAATKGTVLLAKQFFVWLKNLFTRRAET